MNKIKQIASNKKTVAKLLLVLLVLVALPVTLVLVRQSQDQRSDASYNVTAYIGTTSGFNVIHAYNYDGIINRSGYSWARVSNNLTRTGRAITYMQTNPNDSAALAAGQGPELIYNLYFQAPGTYYFYARTGGAGSGADDFHYGVDGARTNSHNGHWGNLNNGEDIKSYWAWTKHNNDGSRSKIYVSTPGFHTFHIWMRESGARMHKFRLITNSAWVPSVNISDWGPTDEPARSTVSVGTPTPKPATPTPKPTATPTPIPCVRQNPQIDIIGDANKDVIQEETVEFTVRITNRNSAQCAPSSFNMSTIFNPTTTDINYTFSEPSFTLNSGESRDVLVTFTPGKEVAGSSVTAVVKTTDRSSNKSSTANLTMNVIILTTLNFNKIILHGIGIGGDNVNPTGGGNPNPLTTSKTLDVRFFDAGGNQVAEESGDITFSNTNGYFSGSFSTNSRLDGVYVVKIKTHKYLWEDLTGIYTIIEGETNDMPDSELTAGDINSDDQITIDDYDILVGCYSDLLPAENCTGDNKFNSDLTDDGNVNQNDYNLLLREWSNQPGA